MPGFILGTPLPSHLVSAGYVPTIQISKGKATRFSRMSLLEKQLCHWQIFASIGGHMGGIASAAARNVWPHPNALMFMNENLK